MLHAALALWSACVCTRPHDNRAHQASLLCAHVPCVWLFRLRALPRLHKRTRRQSWRDEPTHARSWRKRCRQTLTPRSTSKSWYDETHQRAAAAAANACAPARCSAVCTHCPSAALLLCVYAQLEKERRTDRALRRYQARKDAEAQYVGCFGGGLPFACVVAMLMPP